MCYRIGIDELAECRAVYPGRITRGGVGGVISLTTIDNKKGCWGFSFVFSVCVYVCMFDGDGGSVLIKYSGKLRFILL